MPYHRHRGRLIPLRLVRFPVAATAYIDAPFAAATRCGNGRLIPGVATSVATQKEM